MIQYRKHFKVSTMHNGVDRCYLIREPWSQAALDCPHRYGPVRIDTQGNYTVVSRFHSFEEMVLHFMKIEKRCRVVK